jgi:hypothetical protein
VTITSASSVARWASASRRSATDAASSSMPIHPGSTGASRSHARPDRVALPRLSAPSAIGAASSPHSRAAGAKRGCVASRTAWPARCSPAPRATYGCTSPRDPIAMIVMRMAQQASFACR